MRRIELRIMICAVLVALSMDNGLAQGVKLSGEIRTRSEYRDGFQKPIGGPDSAAVVTNMRTRLTASYTTNAMKSKITIQDTRTFGQTVPGASATGTLAVYEAWGEYLIAPGVSAAMGRQALEYDDKRLFSASNWSNTGNAHDVLLLKYSGLGFVAHAGFAWNSAKDDLTDKSLLLSGGKQYYKNLNYLWLSKTVGDLGASAIWVNEGFQKDTLAKNGNMRENNYRNTLGGNLWLNGKGVPVNVYLTGYYQYGHQYSLSKKLTQKVEAYMLAGKVQARVHRMVTATVGADYYSGTTTGAAGDVSHTFGKLYGTNHSFNGSMEYWTTPPTQGLADWYAGVEVKPMDKLKADVTLHKFDMVHRPKTGDRNLGGELDVTVTYDVSPEVWVQCGYSAYFVTEATRIAKGVSKFATGDPQWGYVMVAFRPVFK